MCPIEYVTSGIRSSTGEYLGATPIFAVQVQRSIPLYTFFLFADDSKVSQQMLSNTDYKSLQADVESFSSWCEK